MALKRDLLLAVLAVTVLVACGTPGAPRPPSLQLPLRVDDLSATRKGDKVTLSWTPPRQTTDLTNIRLRQLGPTRICRGVNDPAMVRCDEAVGELPPSGPPATKENRKATFTDILPPSLPAQQPAGFATYAVEVLNARRRSAGLSNQVQVPLAPTAPAPQSINAKLFPNFILITAEPAPGFHTPPGMTLALRLYRREQGASSFAEVPCVNPKGLATGMAQEPIPLKPTLEACADDSFAWEKTYVYKVAPVTRVLNNGKIVTEVEGDDSPAITVFAHDVFPPAAPSGLQAVYSGVGQKPFIDLTWAPNTEPDLAGYNLYRRQAGTPAEKINHELIKVNSFRDNDVAAGHTYVYAVTAVDLRGNESARSEETSESVP
jgi:hypothetical protein